MKHLMLIVAIAAASLKTVAQRDTLHIYYDLSSTKLSDTSDKKIDKWVANLKGQQVKINVYAYYSKGAYEKFAQERADELFLILNRKARALLKIESIGPKKGKDSQRSTVDIVYDAPRVTEAEKPKTEPPKTETEPAVAGTETPKNAAEVKSAEKAEEKKDEKKPEVTEEKKTAAAVAETKPEKKAPESNNKPETRPVVKETSATAQASKSSGSSADLDKYTAAKDPDFKSKTLVIVLPGEEGAEYEKARKKGGAMLTEYTAFSKSFGEAAHNVFPRRWPYSKVSYSNLSEGEKMAKENDKMVVRYVKKEKGDIPVVHFELKSPIYENIIKVTLAGNEASEADVMMLAHKIARLANVRGEFERDQLKNILGARKLYIATEQLNMSQEQVAQSYPYPFSVVSNSELTKIIANGAAGSAYLKSESVNGTMNLVLVDGTTGLLLSRAPAENGKVTGSVLADLVNENKQLQEITPLTVY